MQYEMKTIMHCKMQAKRKQMIYTVHMKRKIPTKTVSFRLTVEDIAYAKSFGLHLTEFFQMLLDDHKEENRRSVGDVASRSAINRTPTHIEYDSDGSPIRDIGSE